MLRLRFLAKAAFVAFAFCAPFQQAGAQPKVEYRDIQNLKAQQTSIENRIADLQRQVDDAYAGKEYCSAEERTEDYNRLRALQREIAALRREYAEFKAGFIKLAATQTAGPEFDAAGIHPDERSYWTADDNALRKLSESASAKATRVEQSTYRDCTEKTTTSPGPATPPPAKSPEKPGDQGKTPPVTPQAPPKGPTVPLGGCTDNQRHEAILRIQEEILRLEKELIPIDGTKPEGRARQLQLIAEIDRLKKLMDLACPPLLPPIEQPPPPAKPAQSVPKTVEKPAPEKPQTAPGPQTAPTPQATGGLGAKLDEAEKKLDADIKACRSISVEEYNDLVREAFKNFQLALKASKGGAPVDTNKTNADYERAKKLRDRAQAAANKACAPPQEQPQNAEPSKTLSGVIYLDPFQKLEDDAEDALDDLEDAMDDCAVDAVKAMIPRLEDLSRAAHAEAEAAAKAGKIGKAFEARAMAEDLDEAIEDAKKFKCLINPGLKHLRLLGSTELGILNIHNTERAEVSAQPLKWNFKLEWGASGYAGVLAETHQLTHASREGRGIVRENLGQGRAGSSPDRIVRDEWTSEKRYFRAGVFPDVCEGDWTQCAHYSQMIWPTTTDLGCGWAAGGGFEWVVCRYSPGGNKDGKPVGYHDASAVFSAGPLLFEPSYSPVLKAYRPSNPDRLEFGDESVNEWRSYQASRMRCSVRGMNASIEKLKYYAQAAREHSVEEKSKGNGPAAGSYSAMAKQIDERVRHAESERDECVRTHAPERG
jgi:hypothetical protein